MLKPAYYFYFALDRGAKYCNEYVCCLSVCLCVCVFVCPVALLENYTVDFAIFCTCCLWPWFGPPLTVLRYVLHTSGFVDDVFS